MRLLREVLGIVADAYANEVRRIHRGMRHLVAWGLLCALGVLLVFAGLCFVVAGVYLVLAPAVGYAAAAFITAGAALFLGILPLLAAWVLGR